MSKHHDKVWLEKKYWEDNLEQSEIANICGVTGGTISRWMKKHNIPTDFSDWISSDELNHLYHDEKLSLREIENKFNVDSETVRRSMDENGVETRDRLDYQSHILPSLKMNSNGYYLWQEQSHEENKVVKVHRLVAISEYGFDAVAEKHVHHTNQIKFDNRPENLELLSPSEHMELHAKERKFWEESPR